MTPLHFAAQLGCADMVQRLLDRNADINCRNMFDVTPLHFVCDSKDSHKDILQLLLEAGADPHLKELRFQHTPLHKAAIRGHFEIISILLTKALKINDKCQLVIKLPWKKRRMHSFNWGIFYEIICEYHESKTALHLAAENGHAKAIEVLLNHNASIDIAESETSKTALHLAAENGHKSVVKVLVERGANLRKKDYANKIPFHYAIKHHKKDKELIELLTIDNFNLDLFDEDYDEIHDAGVCGRLDILKLYDESDIFYSPDQFGRTIFHYAAENGDLNLVQYLLTVKCQQPKGYCHSETRDIFGYTPLYFAVSKGHSDIVLCILQSDKQKVDKDRKYGYYNQTLLHIAAEKGFTNIVKYFLHSKYYSFSVDGKLNPLYDRNDKTPLHIAAEKGYEEIVQLLLENGASIHIKDCVSYTPLHYGVESGKTKIVELLLQKGFPLRLRWHEESWNKAITNVACKGHTEVIEFLIQTGELNIMPSAQCTAPLHHAIIYCQKEMISLLLSYIDISASLKFGPMHVAAEHGLIDIAELLRKHGISADDGDNDGLRPLHYACRASQVEMVDYLLRTGEVRDPMKVSKEGLSPLDVIAPESTARTKLLQLFRPYVDSHTDYPIETYAKVFMCGYSTAGKSSLSQALVDRSKKPLGYKFSPLEKVKDVTPFTVGIDLHTISSPEIGNIVLYDFAGHTEFYSSHAGILENLMLHSPGVFVIIADLTKPRSKVQSELFYWLNFIENACAKLPKPSQVILVGSRADSFSKHGLEFKADMNDLVEEAVVKQIFKGYCALECHKPGGIGMNDFVSILATSCKEVVNRSDGISYYCHLLYSLLKDLNEIAITFENLSIKIKKNPEVTISDDPAFLSNTLLTLSDKGLILYLKSNDPSTSWIVVDRVKLLHEVVGVLFAPASIERVHRDIASNIGIVKFSQLKSIFKSQNFDALMLKGFLTALEFCQVIDSDILDSSYDYSEELLFFPALIAEKQPAEMKKAPSRGWYLKCTNPHKFFTVRFLHVLILRLALFHVSSGKKSEELDRRCTVWKDGINWISHNIEVLVQVSLDDRCITVLISDKDNLIAQKMFASVISEIHSLMNRLSPCATKEYIINPSQLEEVSKLKKEDVSLFLLQNVAQAMILRQQVSDEGGQYDRSIDIILDSFEPYLFIPPFITQELFNAELSNNKIHQSRLDCLLLVCPDMMKGTAFNSYKEVRDHIQSFSIFTGHNVVNLALSCDSATSKEKKQLDHLLTKPLLFEFKERKPLKQEMLKLLSGEVSSDWSIFGTYLNLPSDFIKNLRESNASSDQKFAQVVETWLSKSNIHCTWNKVIETLEDMNHGKAIYNVKVFLGENAAKSPSCTETGDELPDETDRAASPETLSTSINTESVTNVPLVALTSTPMPSTFKAESICTDEPSMPFPNDMSVINPGTSGSNTSTPHSSPQKGMTTSVDIDSSCKDNTSGIGTVSYSQAPSIANNTSAAHDSCSLQQQHIYTMIIVSIHVFTFLNGLFANQYSSMSSNSGKIADDVLMKCSSHLDHLPKLAGYLRIPDRCLQQIQNDFTDPDIQGYCLLKKWKELYPNSSLADLIKVFQYLGLNEAVKVLEEN
ncbi:PREDICTED: uncharacterized protein LOC100641765 [Amphimedon queenslandica]|uniref:Death domain-containing protein n=1 Tax=Amphimedon queenslandica TaxID=400682 RepID=A0AAN0J615_AMPQE|nr:PREDICTED: uncharacterized protein LOC100641765 [Amphimedon queenslandica]|eukprot:XP_019852459.1 PREDICTED: uncharacterized protein LOC100641765 [Amphimedon queenslandica]